MTSTLISRWRTAFWIYNPKTHSISQLMPDDVRGETTTGQTTSRPRVESDLCFGRGSDEEPSGPERALTGIADSA